MESKNCSFESLVKGESNASPERAKHDELDMNFFSLLNLNDIPEEKNLSLIKKQDEHELMLEQNKILKFNPPLYLQRYDYVCDLLKQYQCRSFMDIGAAECKMLRYLKNSSELNIIIGLDIDESILYSSKEKFSIGWFDYIQSKEQPMEVYLIRGDISEPCSYFLREVSSENMNLDFVSMVELIEHLYPDDLAKCITTVFAKIKPKMVLITTPNQEFNVVFQDTNILNGKHSKFRHWDHKFEWTQQEFQFWCQSEILDKFTDYELIFYGGLGQPPEHYSNVGYCTQTAFFKKKQISSIKNTNKYEDYLTCLKKANYMNRQSKSQNSQEKIQLAPYFDSNQFENTNYRLISFTRYPFDSFEFDNIESRNQAIINEICYLINFLSKPSSTRNDEQFSEEMTDEKIEKLQNNLSIYDDSIRIASVEKIFCFSSIKKFNLSHDELFLLMKSEGFQFTNSGKYVFQMTENNVIESDGSDSSWLNLSSAWDNDQPIVEENWDEDVPLNFAEQCYTHEEDWDEEMISSSNLKNNSTLISSLNIISNQKEQISLQEQFADVENDVSCDFPNNNRNGKIKNECKNKLNISSQNRTYDCLFQEYEINYKSNQSKKLALKFKSTRRKYHTEFKKKTFDLKIVPSQFSEVTSQDSE